MADMEFCRTKSYTRGSVWYVNLGENKVGNEQEGTRPAVIVSNDMNNKYSPNVNVVIATTKVKKKNDLPVHVKASLHRESCFMCEQIITVSKQRLKNYIGRLNEDKMEEINGAMLVQLGVS